MSSHEIACAVLIAAVLGPLSHLLIWIRFELNSVVIQTLVLVTALAIPLPFVVKLRELSIFKALTLCSAIGLTYAISLLASIGVYRAFLHPLNKFPGPFWAKISSFWKVKHYSTFRTYRLIDDLHHQYGPVVRIGPRHLSINEPAGVSTVQNFSRPKIGEYARRNIISLANPQEHKARRAAWDQGLNGKACASYLPLLNSMAKTMCAQLSSFKGRPVRVNELCHFYTSDIISELAFGSSFDQFKTLRANDVLAKITKFLAGGVLIIQVPWLVSILTTIPWIENPMDDLVAWANQSLRKRDMGLSSEKKGKVDIMSYMEVTGETAGSKWPITFQDICEDAAVLIIGGTDTSASVLTHGLHYLANYPELQETIRAEILPTFSDGAAGEFVWSTLSSPRRCPYLDAFVNEILRHQPPVLQGTFRESPDHQVEIAGHVIPPKTILTCPIWSIQHDERCFKSAEEFIPERWLDASHPQSRADLVLDKKGFVPFLMGPAVCAGRLLAYMEIKLCFAHILKQFRVAYVAGKELMQSTEQARRQRDQIHDQKVKDYMTQWVPDVEVCFIPSATPSE